MLEKCHYTCDKCGVARTLVVQLYGPTPASSWRTIYIFACLSKQCRQDPHRIIALSEHHGHVEDSDLADVPAAPSHEIADLEASFRNLDFNIDSEDEIGDDEIERLLGLSESRANSSAAEANVAADKMPPGTQDTATSSSRHGHNDQGPSVSKSFYLCAVPEPTSDGKKIRNEIIKAKLLLRDYERMQEAEPEDGENRNASSHAGFAEEDYEVDPEKQFLKFVDRIDRLPEQCVRYELGGSPISIDPRSALMSPSDARCVQCGEKR